MFTGCLPRIHLFLVAFAVAENSIDPYGQELQGHKAVHVKCIGRNQLPELETLNIDIWWRDFNATEAILHVNEHQLDILHQLPEYKITAVHEDLAEYTKQFKRTNLSNHSDSDWFSNYHTYAEIRSWYQQLAKDNSEYISFVSSIGITHQRRDIFAIRINPTPSRTDKKQIWIQGLIHAREWISGAVVQYITKKLSTIKEHSAHHLLPDVEYIVIPVVNPDGYEYTWTHNRLWRKNMAPSIFGQGVDLNRNFDSHWGSRGSKIPISDTYCGPRAASEPETVAIQNFFHSQKKIVGVIDWHCYSQLILFPYGWTNRPVKNIEFYKYLTDKMVKAFALNHRRYVAEQSSQLYPTSGSATDWFEEHGAISLAIELPPSAMDGAGFLLGPEHIKSVGEESWEAFKVFVNVTVAHSDSRMIRGY